MIAFIMLPEDPPPQSLRILHLEDSAVDHELVRRALHKSGEHFTLERVEKGEQTLLIVLRSLSHRVQTFRGEG